MWYIAGFVAGAATLLLVVSCLIVLGIWFWKVR